MVGGIARRGGVTATLTAGNLTAGHRDRCLLSGLDLVIEPGEATWLVGVNEAGKSTLLRLRAGLDQVAAEAGPVVPSPPSATVGYLFVDWTPHLTGNHKERLPVDGCGLDRLAGIITAPPKPDRGRTYKTHE